MCNNAASNWYVRSKNLMKNVFKNSALALLITAFSSYSLAEVQEAEQPPAVNNDDIAYFMGYQFGTAIVQQGSGNLNPDVISEALKAALSGSASTQSETMQQAVIAELQARARRQQEQAIAMIKSQSEEFLAENKAREGVKETSSGLQYEVIEEGSGVAPTASDRVTVHYEGRLVSGQVFDSSLQRGEPVTFGLNQVIAGWTEGLQLMKEGGHIRLYIPADLGYGPGGTRTIPPHSALIFDVQLITVVKADAAN